jgi:hypothetical protein
MDTKKFNHLAGKAVVTGYEELNNQLKLIEEELKETREALDKQNKEGILDGAIDVAVTLFGFMQILENMKFDVAGASEAVATNNLTKFPVDENIAKQTVDKYKNFNAVDAHHHKVFYGYNTYYVIKNKETNKVLKPVGYESVNLKEFIGDN